MKKCTYCGRENDDEAVQCPQCGMDEFRSGTETDSPIPSAEATVTELEFVLLDPAQRKNDFVTLLRCRTLLEADFIVSRLEGAGIHAFIPDEFLMQSISWNVNTYGFVRVQVSANDYQAAKEFLLAAK